MAHIRQSRPDSGLGVQVKVRKSFSIVSSLLGSGQRKQSAGVEERDKMPLMQHHLTQSVFGVVVQESSPTQIRQRILYMSKTEE